MLLERRRGSAEHRSVLRNLADVAGREAISEMQVFSKSKGMC